MKKIKVLVVDDSLFMRTYISELIESDPQMEVIATANDGLDALRKIPRLKPDVITLDLNMPKTGGLATLQQIMAKFPTPVIIISAHSTTDAEITLDCLRSGAVDFVLKPGGEVSLNIKIIKAELLQKIKVAARARISKIKAVLAPHRHALKKEKLSGENVVVIGASTGGPQAIEQVLGALPASVPAAIIIVQHLPAKFTASFAQRLDAHCPITVQEARNGDSLKSGTAFVAPGGYNLNVEKRGKELVVKIIKKSAPQFNHEETPNIDVAMASVARSCGKKAVGVLLTGMGDDGVAGLQEIQSHDGKTIVQDEATSLIYGMPKRAKEKGVADYIVPLPKISQKLGELLR